MRWPSWPPTPRLPGGSWSANTTSRAGSCYPTPTGPNSCTRSARARRPWVSNRSRDGDDDLAAGVPLLHVVQAGGGVGQRVGPVEHRGQLPVLDEPGEGEQVLRVRFGEERPQPPPDD